MGPLKSLAGSERLHANAGAFDADAVVLGIGESEPLETLGDDDLRGDALLQRESLVVPKPGGSRNRSRSKPKKASRPRGRPVIDDEPRSERASVRMTPAVARALRERGLTPSSALSQFVRLIGNGGAVATTFLTELESDMIRQPDKT